MFNNFENSLIYGMQIIFLGILRSKNNRVEIYGTNATPFNDFTLYLCE